MILLLITSFSRNYLGVHTPQDVLFALAESFLGIYTMNRIFRYVENDPEKEDILLLLEFLFAVTGLIYVTVKSYPMEYIDGTLIVDPVKMMNDGYGDIGMMMTYPIARYIEKRWIRFRPVGFGRNGLIAGACGLILFCAIRELLNPYLISQFGSHWGKLYGSAVLVSFCIAVYPLIIKLLFNKETVVEDDQEETRS